MGKPTRLASVLAGPLIYLAGVIKNILTTIEFSNNTLLGLATKVGYTVSLLNKLIESGCRAWCEIHAGRFSTSASAVWMRDMLDRSPCKN
jgi:hypothetical protein